MPGMSGGGGDGGGSKGGGGEGGIGGDGGGGYETSTSVAVSTTGVDVTTTLAAARAVVVAAGVEKGAATFDCAVAAAVGCSISAWITTEPDSTLILTHATSTSAASATACARSWRFNAV